MSCHTEEHSRKQLVHALKLATLQHIVAGLIVEHYEQAKSAKRARELRDFLIRSARFTMER